MNKPRFDARPIASIAFVLLTAVARDALHAQEAQRSVLDGVYSEAQANRGAAAYDA
jgi:hypothetical protein